MAARGALLAGSTATETRLELAGISTAVLVAGAGPPMVLLHGPAEQSLRWLDILPQLTATHRVIAPDLPGHGETVVTSGTIDVARVIAWLDALIDATCDLPPILLGHVVGGAIAARYAAQRPQHVAQLVLVDTLGLVPLHPAPELERVLQAYLAQPADESYEALWEKCATDAAAVRARLGERWQWLRQSNVERARAAALQEPFQALMAAFGFPPIPAEELARIAVPTSLIWGRHDLATRLSVAESASARYGWPLHIVDAGDDPATEQPDAFLSALRASERAAVATAAV